MAGDAELAALIARIRSIAVDAGPAIAREAVEGIDAAVKATAAAGTDPEGRAWAARKDGARALANAAGAISTRALGSLVEVLLRGKYVYHHLGKGSPERRILPDAGAGVPPQIAAPIRDAARRVLARLLSGGAP